MIRIATGVTCGAAPPIIATAARCVVGCIARLASVGQAKTVPTTYLAVRAPPALYARRAHDICIHTLGFRSVTLKSAAFGDPVAASSQMTLMSVLR